MLSYYIAGVVKRTFWGLMTVACMVFLVYHLTTSCILYLAHGTSVTVTIVTRRQLTFPAVTICNLNPVKKSAVSESSALSRLINDDNRKRKKRDTSALERLVDDDNLSRKKRGTGSAVASFGEYIRFCFCLEQTASVCCYLLNVAANGKLHKIQHIHT